MMMDFQSVLRLAIPHTARSREPIYNTLLWALFILLYIGGAEEACHWQGSR